MKEAACGLLVIIALELLKRSASIISRKEGMRTVKPSYAFLLMLMAISLTSFPGLTQEKQEITHESLEWTVRNLDWIIQGQVISIEPISMTFKELFGDGNNKNIMVVTEIKMRVEKAIAGEYEETDLIFIIPEGKLDGCESGIAGESPMHVRVGDRAIVGLVLNTRATSYNILDNRDSFYKIEGGELVPYQANRYFSFSNPLHVIERTAREREMPEIFKSADLVCFGTVTDVLREDIRSPKLVVKIGETIKGSVINSEITIDVTNTSRSFEDRRPGYQVLLFLKKVGHEYSPVAGINGYYVVDGENITRGHNLPLRMKVSQLKSKFSAWKEQR